MPSLSIMSSILRRTRRLLILFGGAPVDASAAVALTAITFTALQGVGDRLHLANQRFWKRVRVPV